MAIEEYLQVVTIWMAIGNGGDGSVYPIYFLTEAEANEWEDNQSEGWGESSVTSLETFVGSDVYFEAKENENIRN